MSLNRQRELNYSNDAEPLDNINRSFRTLVQQSSAVHIVRVQTIFLRHQLGEDVSTNVHLSLRLIHPTVALRQAGDLRHFWRLHLNATHTKNNTRTSVSMRMRERSKV